MSLPGASWSNDKNKTGPRHSDSPSHCWKTLTVTCTRDKHCHKLSKKKERKKPEQPALNTFPISAPQDPRCCNYSNITESVNQFHTWQRVYKSVHGLCICWWYTAPLEVTEGTLCAHLWDPQFQKQTPPLFIEANLVLVAVQNIVFISCRPLRTDAASSRRSLQLDFRGRSWRRCEEC